MTKYSLRRIISIAAIFIVIVVAVVGYVGFRKYSKLYAPSVDLGELNHTFINIPTGSTYADVLKIIEKTGYVADIDDFKWVSSRMGYPQSVKPGRYMLKNNMSNRTLVAILRSGQQTPVRLTFIGFRTPQQLAQRVSSQIEADSAEIVKAFASSEIVKQYGFTKQTFISMFIPNTYEFFWNTSAKGFFDRMKKEHDAFWSGTRDKKAIEIGLDRIKVSTLASIVEEETVKVDERPRVAGVFMNRLQKGMPLQADPTVKFAVGDFSIRRILKKHLQVDSPYNTYRNKGLPPGPINAPSISSINAVLNYEKHQYLYFCAKPDYSGYHSFARTLAEHNRNAKVYQDFLNRERIFR
jgi:UPF0755 protein